MLVKRSSPSNLTYIAEYKSGRLEHKMDHLVQHALRLFGLMSKLRLSLNKCEASIIKLIW